MILGVGQIDRNDVEKCCNNIILCAIKEPHKKVGPPLTKYDD